MRQAACTPTASLQSHGWAGHSLGGIEHTATIEWQEVSQRHRMGGMRHKDHRGTSPIKGSLLRVWQNTLENLLQHRRLVSTQVSGVGCDNKHVFLRSLR